MNGTDKNKSQGRLAKYLLVSYAIRRASYMIRALAGAYLIYLMYQLFAEAGSSGEELTVLMAAAAIFMMVAGIYFVIGGAYALLNGIYEENEPAGEPQERDLEAAPAGERAESAETLDNDTES